ncbi:DUF4277 domain-containing protein [Halotia branconii CENA392]|uniref:DUF4277 domain-containing protein n=1 Tax=Halotia branconii CENA392 TaxID=1539056 RepID=A0AAJ6NWR8_9CYAN|nr:DUF4277 domain-containing protein [Halotia branconii]WGV28159.1 DUF4277 domain-containing protein [Halotia branconii CENA392]
MVSQPLYMFPKFFELIACEHLIGVGTKPEYYTAKSQSHTTDLHPSSKLTHACHFPRYPFQ